MGYMKKLPSINTINQLFIYDKDAGKLIWNIRKPGVSFGCEAGTTDTKGYRKVSINGLGYRIHRIIYKLENPNFDESLEVDHLDGDTLNNYITNLEAATRKQNGRNQKLYRTNTTGQVGVLKAKRKGYWQAYIWVGKHIKLGSHPTFELAVQARENAENKYGFNKRHGNIK